jgi:hypothetical protein
MSREIEFVAPTGLACYATITNAVGLWFNSLTNLFENFNAGQWNNYVVATAEDGTTSTYFGSFPFGVIAEGVYNVVGRQRVGGSPAQSDLPVASGTIEWNGSAVADLWAQTVQIDNDVLAISSGAAGVRLLAGVTHGGTDTRLLLDDTSGIGIPFSMRSAFQEAVSILSTVAPVSGGGQAAITIQGTDSGMSIKGQGSDSFCYGMRITGNGLGAFEIGGQGFAPGLIITGGNSGGSGVVLTRGTAAGHDLVLTNFDISTPPATAGRPTSIMAMIRRLFEWSSNKKTRDTSNGQKKVFDTDLATILETQVQSTTGSVDQETQGA